MSPNDFLQYGQVAVERAVDSILDDSAIIDPMQSQDGQKKKRGTQRGKLVIIIANGYAGYNSAKEEVKALKGGLWLPNTVDFRATAARTRNKQLLGASNADEFFGGLQGVSGRISRLVYIGHGFPGGLGLSGEAGPGGDLFGETLGPEDLTRWQEDINKSIKPKFIKNARMDLVACNIAVGRAFVQKLANAMGICVRAFDEAVEWCTTYKKEPAEIASRGRIGARSVVAGKPCSDKAWSRGVNSFVPPEKLEVCP